MATELFPILATRDLDRALSFYRDLLGGTVSFEFTGPDGRPAYVGLDVGSSHLGIGFEADAAVPPLPGPVSLWVYVDDCDAVVDGLRRAGISIREEPADQPWGERIARVLDPDGNEIVIGAKAPRD
jgi:lactoylglutathione lyase